MIGAGRKCLWRKTSATFQVLIMLIHYYANNEEVQCWLDRCAKKITNGVDYIILLWIPIQTRLTGSAGFGDIPWNPKWSHSGFDPWAKCAMMLCCCRPSTMNVIFGSRDANLARTRFTFAAHICQDRIRACRKNIRDGVPAGRREEGEQGPRGPGKLLH